MGRWTFVLYPDAAEGGGAFRSVTGINPSGGRFDPDPERNGSDAVRRARRTLRRYCASHRLNRLGTLTYGAPYCRDPKQLRHDVADFIRRLRREVREPFPYVWVPELHADGERFHVHFAVGRFIHYRAIRRAWRHGFIDIRMLSDLPVGTGALGEARKAAAYLSKYVGKDLDAGGRPSGLHRYDVARGFPPRRSHFHNQTADGVLAEACERMGSLPSRIWRSRDEERWDGPPAVWASWT